MLHAAGGLLSLSYSNRELCRAEQSSIALHYTVVELPSGGEGGDNSKSFPVVKVGSIRREEYCANCCRSITSNKQNKQTNSVALSPRANYTD
jgi:hypothetical protein